MDPDEHRQPLRTRVRRPHAQVEVVVAGDDGVRQQRVERRRVPGMGAVGPGVTASRTPVHGAAGSGARKRRSPTGAAAYGMPRKATTPPVRTPCTAPAAVSAMIDVAVLTGRAFRAGCRPRNGAGPDQRRVGAVPVRRHATAASRAALASSLVSVRSGARKRRA